MGVTVAGSDVWYSCRIDDLQLDVYLTGVGWKGTRTFPSSLLKEKPDLCISSGLAGGLKPELKSGEIVVAREALLVNGGKKFRSRPLLVNLAEETGATPVNLFRQTPKSFVRRSPSDSCPSLAMW